MLADRSDEILTDIYKLPGNRLSDSVFIPSFQEATSVRGAFGWFNAGWIGRLAPGLASFIERDPHHRIELALAPGLFPAEYDAVRNAFANDKPPVDAGHALLRELAAARDDDSRPLAQHAVDCLTWLVAHERLRIHIAIPQPDSTFHPKVWIFTDGTDSVAVRGSGNATGPGVYANVEQADVDSTFAGVGTKVDRAREYVDAWIAGTSDGLLGTVQLSVLEDFEDTVSKLAPPTQPTSEQLEAQRRRQRALDRQRVLVGPPRSNLRIPSDLRWQDGPYSHQGDAVKAWEDAGRGGILSMATGAGKTKTSLICATRAYQELTGPMLLVVSAPSKPLVHQWVEELRSFGIDEPLTPTLVTKPERRRMLAKAGRQFKGLDTAGVIAMVVTHNRVSSAAFQNLLRKRFLAERPDGTAMLIGDEAHRLGTENFMDNPPGFFELRLGLSATIERQYDDEGTRRLFEFFGPEVFTFSIRQAIGLCLVPYNLHVRTAVLAGDEMRTYREFTRKIGRAVAANDGQLGQSAKLLAIQRRGIIETAAAKVTALPEIMRHIHTDRGSHRHTLVFTSSKNPAQYDQALPLLQEITTAEGVTQDQSRSDTVLEGILERFTQGQTSVVVAKQVLDEGVDIPDTRNGVLLASSTVTREWVQRRGRVLRMAGSDKTHADLYDVVALPDPDDIEAWDTGSKKIVRQEIERLAAFGLDARNASEVADHIAQLRETYLEPR